MAALSITATSVVPDTDAVKQTGVAAESITAGQPVYLTTSNTVGVADTNAASPAYIVVGIALHAASTGQPITYQTAGTITIGATVTVGEIYILGATAGDICPRADLTTGWYTCVLGIATTAAKIKLCLFSGLVAKA